jgi:hypothetical protein
MTRPYDAAYAYVTGETALATDEVEWVAKQDGLLPAPPLYVLGGVEPPDNEYWRARIFRHGNNRNPGVQRDQKGRWNNLIYYDGDNGCNVGPVGNPELTVLHGEAVDVYRPAIKGDFYEPSLPRVFEFTSSSGGSCAIVNGEAQLKTGNPANSWAMLRMPGVPLRFINQAKVKFYLRTQPNGYLNLDFGIMGDDGNNYAKFDRYEEAVAQPYRCISAYNGTPHAEWAPNGGDSLRRQFEIKFNGLDVEYWMTDLPGAASQGLPEKVADFSASHPNPAVIGRPYVRIKSLYADAPRTVFVSWVYAMPLA